MSKNQAKKIPESLPIFNVRGATVETLAAQMKLQSTAINEMLKFLQFMSTQMDDILKSNKEILEDNKKLKERLDVSEENQKKLEEKVNYLELKLDETQQEKNNANLVISGFESSKEDMTSIINEIVTEVDKNFKETDIVEIVPEQKNDNGKFTKFVVKFRNKEIKDQLMLSKKEKRIFTTQFNIPDCMSQKQIFFQFHLSPLQKKMYYEAKKIKIAKNFRFLWVKDGAILLRESSESRKIYKITNYNNLSTVKAALEVE
jgi:chromosome segregation ATPase